MCTRKAYIIHVHFYNNHNNNNNNDIIFIEYKSQSYDSMEIAKKLIDSYSIFIS